MITYTLVTLKNTLTIQLEFLTVYLRRFTQLKANEGSLSSPNDLFTNL